MQNQVEHDNFTQFIAGGMAVEMPMAAETAGEGANWNENEDYKDEVNHAYIADNRGADNYRMSFNVQRQSRARVGSHRAAPPAAYGEQEYENDYASAENPRREYHYQEYE